MFPAHFSAHTDVCYVPYSTVTNDFTPDEFTIYQQALDLLQRTSPSTSTSNLSETSSIRINSKPIKARTDSKVDNNDWQPQMYQAYYNSMGGPVTTHIQSNNNNNNKRIGQARSHQRTPSTSTIASTGPASPFMQSASYPHIANTEQAPNSPSYYPESYYGKNLSSNSITNTPGDGSFGNAAFMPSQAAHMSNAHLAMKGFAIDYHNSEDFASDFAPSRQSMSSYGNNSPATPQSGMGEGDASKASTAPPNEYRTPNPNVQLFRTESEAFRDELYNPDTVYTATANPKPVPNLNTGNAYLSPHRNLITERLQTANLARSTSPSALSRQRSPFRDNSPMATDWKQVGSGVATTAASLRQHQAEDSVQAEYGRQRAPLRREPTKTISPKDALLDYTADSDQAPLFQDSIPAGYKQHVGGSESWPNGFINQTNSAFENLPTSQNMSFRNVSSAADNGYSGTTFDFPSLPHGQEDAHQGNPFQANYQTAPTSARTSTYPETPNFPASIPSMETSMSDAGPPASSQESVSNNQNSKNPTSTPQRPADTRANTGTYTCTYHGCTQRFESHATLQRHKREVHRSQQSHQLDNASSPPATGSEAGDSDGSPGPSGGGMTSAAILARNSQAGPHKCNRINPSTGKPCNTVFSRPYDLTRHEDTIHNGRKQKVRCPMCREEKTFSRNDALTRHMRVVHPEVEHNAKRGKRGE